MSLSPPVSPSAAPNDGDSWAFECIDALPGFCRLEKRSPTLDGNLPLRAAQHCAPVFEGNAAGFQVSLQQPMTLRRLRGGALQVNLTLPAFEQTQRLVHDAIERLVRDGLLRRGGPWHRLLATDALPVRGPRLFLWSGFLVRPAHGVCLRVGPAFNRRSRVQVVEHAIAERDGFTPLVLEIDGRDLGQEPRWLADEIGCVLPVAAQARMTLASIRRAPAVVKRFESFFDAHYFETKKSRPTGNYRKKLREQPEAEPAPTCHAKVLYAGPPAHAIGTLQRFHGPAGVSKRAPAGVAVPYGTVKNVARFEAIWDGQRFTAERSDVARVLPALRRDWRAAGGNLAGDGLEFLSGTFFGPDRDEPYWQLQPWVFCVTPPGWSTVVDGASVGGGDGLRGLIRTDQFHPLSMVYRMYRPGPVAVRKGAPLLRFFPVPRRLQSAGMRMVP